MSGGFGFVDFSFRRTFSDFRGHFPTFKNSKPVSYCVARKSRRFFVGPTNPALGFLNQMRVSQEA
jgi:hypothetical protein